MTTRALRLVSGLRHAQLHTMMLAGMAGYYLAQPEVWMPGRDRIARAVFDALGGFGRPALAVHCVRQGRPRAALRVSVGGTAA